MRSNPEVEVPASMAQAWEGAGDDVARERQREHRAMIDQLDRDVRERAAARVADAPPERRVTPGQVLGAAAKAAALGVGVFGAETLIQHTLDK
jgi:hypothetical protein